MFAERGSSSKARLDDGGDASTSTARQAAPGRARRRPARLARADHLLDAAACGAPLARRAGSFLVTYVTPRETLPRPRPAWGTPDRPLGSSLTVRIKIAPSPSVGASMGRT